MPDKECLTLGVLHVRGLRQIEDEDVWLGTALVDGLNCPFHFQAVRVVENEKSGMLEPTNDPHDRMAGVYALYEYKPTTTKIQGLEGDFVVVMHPHAD